MSAHDDSDNVCSASEVLDRPSVLRAREEIYRTCATLMAKGCNGKELLVALADVQTHTACHIAEEKDAVHNGRQRKEGKTNQAANVT